MKATPIWTEARIARALAPEAPPRRRQALLTAAARDPALAERVRAQQTVDQLLRAVPAPTVSPAGLWRVRQALDEALRPASDPEIMTLPEVAAFLRLPEAAMAEIIGQLPAFELAGHLRVRRTRLLEWLAQREQGYQRAHLQHWFANDAPPRRDSVA